MPRPSAAHAVRDEWPRLAARTELGDTGWCARTWRLIVSAILSVCFVFFFGVGRSLGHLVMVMSMLGLTVFLGLLIHHMDAPFGEVMGIDPDVFTRYFPTAA